MRELRMPGNKRPKNYRLGPDGPVAEYELIGAMTREEATVTRHVRMISTGEGMRYEPELFDGEELVEDIVGNVWISKVRG